MLLLMPGYIFWEGIFITDISNPKVWIWLKLQNVSLMFFPEKATMAWKFAFASRSSRWIAWK